jgi:sulfur carrier protein
MKRIKINGNWHEVSSTTLEELLNELDYSDTVVATAKNQEFVRVKDRSTTKLNASDEIEILTPMQGG